MNPINFNEYKDRIISALENKGFRMRTEGVNVQQYALIDGFINQPIYNQLSNNVVIGGPTVPMIMIVKIGTGELSFFPVKALITISI